MIEAARLAQTVGALVLVDAVHYAPHRLVNVRAMGCDFLACLAYEFYGPHAAASVEFLASLADGSSYRDRLRGGFYVRTADERLGLAREGLVRIGCACYTTEGEVERLLDAVREVARVVG